MLGVMVTHVGAVVLSRGGLPLCRAEHSPLERRYQLVMWGACLLPTYRPIGTVAASRRDCVTHVVDRGLADGINLGW